MVLVVLLPVLPRVANSLFKIREQEFEYTIHMLVHLYSSTVAAQNYRRTYYSTQHAHGEIRHSMIPRVQKVL